MTKPENDLELTTYHRDLRSRIDPFNVCLRDGKLDAAFLLAMEIETAANRIQRRLNELKYSNEV